MNTADIMRKLKKMYPNWGYITEQQVTNIVIVLQAIEELKEEEQEHMREDAMRAVYDL